MWRNVLAVPAALVDLALPQQCAGCGTVSGPFCAGCSLRLGAPPFRASVRPRAGGRLPPVWAAAHYDGPVRAAVVAYKDRGRRALVDPLGAALGRALDAAAREATVPGPAPLLVPVPTARGRLRERGYDALALLVAAALRAWQGPAGATLAAPAPLRHVRPVADQTGLDASARAANLSGALAVSPVRAPPLRNRSVVVVDDVVTTGATLAETVRAVEAVGARVCAAAVLAATPRAR